VALSCCPDPPLILTGRDRQFVRSLNNYPVSYYLIGFRLICRRRHITMIEIADPNRAFRELPGPILVLAGPGTGKTYQLAHRVKYLIQEQAVNVEEIAIVTFTTESARHMREELMNPSLGLSQDNVPRTITTMHSLGNQIIGSDPGYFGLPSDYQVLTKPDLRRVLLQDAAFLATGDRSRWYPADERRRSGVLCTDLDDEVCRVCAAYSAILRRCSAIDYDDQIFLACEILESKESLRASWRARTKHLLVDEYQDINEAQFRLIKLLCDGQTEGLFVVGDDDQSIYSFRGGSPKWILSFGEHFGQTARIAKLAVSYRCPEHILKGAQAVVTQYYPERFPKPQAAFANTITENYKIALYNVPSDTSEAQEIAKNIAQLIADKQDDFLILIPNSNYLPPLRDALRRRKIPYKYRMNADDEGIVRLSLLADWVEQPDDTLRLRHVLELVVESHNELIHSVDNSGDGIERQRTKVSNLIAKLLDSCTLNHSLFAAIAQVAPESFMGRLKREALDKLISKLTRKRSHLSSFLEHCGKLVNPGRNPSKLIEEIREWRNEIFGSGSISDIRPVAIFNLPSSKGLQGDYVFVIGVSEGLIPDPQRNLAEQSRLFYVAMTRAKKKLHLFSARTRSAAITYKTGKAASYQMKPSDFISQIPIDDIEKHDIWSSSAKRSAKEAKSTKNVRAREGK